MAILASKLAFGLTTWAESSGLAFPDILTYQKLTTWVPDNPCSNTRGPSPCADASPDQEKRSTNATSAARWQIPCETFILHSFIGSPPSPSLNPGAARTAP